MNAKKIMLAVMSVLLVTVIVMTGVLISRVSQLFQGITGPDTLGGTTQVPQGNSTGKPSGTVTTPQPSETVTTPSTQPSEPTEPPTTLPTEPSHEHTFVLQETIDATCENLGYDILICTECQRQDIQNFIDPLGHNYGPGHTVDPTCTEYGCTRYTCSRCGDVDERSIRDALGHDHQLTASVAATCELDGYDEYVCTRCGDLLIENLVPATGHTDEIIGEVIDPTCTTDGFMLLHCLVCDSYRDQVTPAAGHLFSEWVFAEGTFSRMCETCATVETVLTGELTITGIQTTDGENGQLLQISVGTGSTPDILLFIICDYQNNGTLEYSLTADRGLVVTYIDGSGAQIEVTRYFDDLSPVVIALG